MPPAAKWCNKGGHVAIRLTQGDAVVAVPGVRDGLPRVLGNTTREMEGRLCGKCLPFTEFVQWREINAATGRAIVHHAVAPRHIFAVWHTLDDAESFVSEEVFIYSLLPMEGTGAGVWHAFGGAAGST